MINHTDRCNRMQQRAKEWDAQWPNACQTCHGAGEVSWTENAAPHGSGECWLMDCGDVCDKCAAADRPKCPRCGGDWYDRFIEEACQSLGYDYSDRTLMPKGKLMIECLADSLFNDWLDKREPCPHCGWRWGEVDDQRPCDECYCWEQATQVEGERCRA